MIKFSAPRFRSPCRRGQPHAPDVQEKTSRCLFLTKPPWFITVPPFIPSESISKQPLRATQWAGTRQVTQAEGQSGRGAGTQVSPVQATCRGSSGESSPGASPGARPPHPPTPPARDAAAPPRPPAPARARPARSEQRQPLAAVFTPRGNGPPRPRRGNRIPLRVSGLSGRPSTPRCVRGSV